MIAGFEEEKERDCLGKKESLPKCPYNSGIEAGRKQLLKKLKKRRLYKDGEVEKKKGQKDCWRRRGTKEDKKIEREFFRRRNVEEDERNSFLKSSNISGKKLNKRMIYKEGKVEKRKGLPEKNRNERGQKT